MYKVPEECGDTLEFDQEYVEALKRRAVRRELSGDLMRSLEDLTAASMLEAFQNDDTLIAADRILKKLGKVHAKEELEKKKTVMPSHHFVQTYFSAFSEDPIANSLKNENIPKEKNLTGFAKARKALVDNTLDDIMPACSEEIECNSGNKNFALVLRGTFYLLMGDYSKSMADFDEVIVSEDVDVKLRVNALIKRAILNVQLQESEKSMNDFKEALRLDPKNADIFCHRGQAHLQLDKFKEAKDDFETCISINPNFPIAYIQKCYTEYRLLCRLQDEVKLEDVMKDFEEGIRKFPNCIECYSLFAQVLFERNEYERADSYFQQAMEIDPQNPTLYVHRGLLALEWTEDESKAIEYINKALKIDEKCEFAYETYGTIEIQRGNLKHAVELFDKAIPLAKNETELSHLFSLRNAAIAQAKMSEKMGIRLTSND